MKQLLSLTCLGVLCLLLTSPQLHAQISRKGDQGSPKVIIKKDKNEPIDERSERTEPEVKRERTSTQRRTQRDRTSYPDRQEEPSTRPERRYPDAEIQKRPRTDRRYPSDDRYGDRRERDHREEAGRGDRGHGKFKSAHQDHNCQHPGKGRHLGWHKNKNNKKKKKGKGHR